MVYKVVMEDLATSDLRGILSYITKTLKEPVVAKRVYHSIKEKIKTLDQNPHRCKVVEIQPFHALGVRRLLAENYSAFFVIDEESKTAHVLRVVYNRRDWQNLL